MTFAAVIAELRRGEREHRPETLAAGVDKMAGELRDQLDIGARAVEDDPVDMDHILRDKRDERREPRFRVPRAGKLDHNSQDEASSKQPKVRLLILSALRRRGQGSATSRPNGKDF